MHINNILFKLSFASRAATVTLALHNRSLPTPHSTLGGNKFYSGVSREC
jgi:hypothetical protein